MSRWVAPREDWTRLCIAALGLTPGLIVVGVVLARADAPAWATYVTGVVFTLVIVLRVMVPGFALPAPEAWHHRPPDPRSGGRPR